MKKIFIFLVTLAFAITVPAQTTNTASPKIGLIDLRKVFDEYYKTQLADANLKDEAADMEKELKDMMQDFHKGEDEWKKLLDQANDKAISADERDKNKQAAEKKLMELREKEE